MARVSRIRRTKSFSGCRPTNYLPVLRRRGPLRAPSRFGCPARELRSLGWAQIAHARLSTLFADQPQESGVNSTVLSAPRTRREAMHFVSRAQFFKCDQVFVNESFQPQCVLDQIRGERRRFFHRRVAKHIARKATHPSSLFAAREETRVAPLTNELNEALKRQTATPYHADVRRGLPEMGMSKALVAQSMVTGALRPVPEHIVVRFRQRRR